MNCIIVEVEGTLHVDMAYLESLHTHVTRDDNRLIFSLENNKDIFDDISTMFYIIQTVIAAEHRVGMKNIKDIVERDGISHILLTMGQQ